MKLAYEETEALYRLIREEAMSRRYHDEEIRDCLFDPEKPAEAQFRVDRPLWMSLGRELLPFGKGLVGKFIFQVYSWNVVSKCVCIYQ